jgi:hypothetical protein
MPYYIEHNAPTCEGAWATVNKDGVVLGCHETKAEAIKQMVAIATATGEEAAGEWSSREH